MEVQSQFIEMFGTVKDTRSLCDICRPKQWPTIQTRDFTETGYLVYGANGVIGKYNRYNHEKATILIACRGASCGSVNISEPKSYITGNAMCLDELSNEVDFTYLSFFLKMYNFREIITGGAQPQITYTNLKRVSVPLPEMDFQKRFTILARQADKSKFVGFKSQFIEMFGNPITNPKGWPTKKIKEVAPESPAQVNVQGKVWLLNLDMIEPNSGNIISKVYEDCANALSVQPFDTGNVLFSKLRPYLNKVVVPDEVGLATTELVPLRPDGAILNKVFLSYLLRSDQFVSYANEISGGTKMPRMPLGELRKFDCLLPPMSLQEEFVSIARQADKSKYYIQKTLKIPYTYVV